jgi:hypothetical protein
MFRQRQVKYRQTTMCQLNTGSFIHPHAHFIRATMRNAIRHFFCNHARSISRKIIWLPESGYSAHLESTSIRIIF